MNIDMTTPTGPVILRALDTLDECGYDTVAMMEALPVGATNDVAFDFLMNTLSVCDLLDEFIDDALEGPNGGWACFVRQTGFGI